MKCQICGQKEGEWQCSVCGRVVCTDHAIPTPEGVFCAEHAPQKTGKAKEQAKGGQTSGARALKTLFVTMVILTTGLAAIVLIGQSAISSDPSATQVLPFANAIKTAGNLIVGGVGAFTLLIGVAWLVARRSSV